VQQRDSVDSERCGPLRKEKESLRDTHTQKNVAERERETHTNTEQQRRQTERNRQRVRARKRAKEKVKAMHASKLPLYLAQGTWV